MANGQYFQGTCQAFDLRTCSDQNVQGKNFIDPCSCYHYYQCSNDYQLIHRQCAPETAWDPEKNTCVHLREVTLYQNCDEDVDVWTRCNTTESRLEELKYICTNETSTTSTTLEPTTLEPTTTSGATISKKINPGIVIGSIIGGALIAVIVLIAAFIVYRRRKKNTSIKKNRGTIAHNPEYFENGHPDDPYAVIHDHHVTTDIHMDDPAYNGSTLSGTMNPSNGSCVNAGFDGTEEVEYDNSTDRVNESGYTSTVRRSVRLYESPTSHATCHVDQEAGETPENHSESQENGPRRGNEYVDFNGNKNKSHSGNQSDMTGNDMSPETSSKETNGHTNEDSPNYFVLEAADK